MDRQALVYVDLDARPHLVGKLWTRVRKDKESATFEYDKGCSNTEKGFLWSRR